MKSSKPTHKSKEYHAGRMSVLQKAMAHEPKETVEVPRAWLEGLVAAVARVEAEKSIKGEAVTLLIGYASSARTLLKYL